MLSEESKVDIDAATIEISTTPRRPTGIQSRMTAGRMRSGLTVPSKPSSGIFAAQSGPSVFVRAVTMLSA